jgi:hypothetical protein
MHYSINPQEIETEIENLGHTVTNIWNIKQYRSKQPLSMFFVELKPALNNKDILKKTPWSESASELYRPTERAPLLGEVIANFCG